MRFAHRREAKHKNHQPKNFTLGHVRCLMHISHFTLENAYCWLERVMGIEPTLFAWEARVLPLNDTREA